jgi:hypothetical protein
MDMVTKHVGWQGSLVDTVRELCRRVPSSDDVIEIDRVATAPNITRKAIVDLLGKAPPAGRRHAEEQVEYYVEEAATDAAIAAGEGAIAVLDAYMANSADDPQPPLFLAGSKDEPAADTGRDTAHLQNLDPYTEVSKRNLGLIPDTRRHTESNPTAVEQLRRSLYTIQPAPNPCPTCSHDDDGTCLRTGEAHGRVYECSSYRARGDHGDPR